MGQPEVKLLRKAIWPPKVANAALEQMMQQAAVFWCILKLAGLSSTSLLVVISVNYCCSMNLNALLFDADSFSYANGHSRLF